MLSMQGLIKPVELSTLCLTGFQSFGANRQSVFLGGDQHLHARALSIAFLDGVSERSVSRFHHYVSSFEVVAATVVATDLSINVGRHTAQTSLVSLLAP